MAAPIHVSFTFDPLTAAIVLAYLAIGALIWAAMLWVYRENRDGWSYKDPWPVFTTLAAFCWPITIPIATLSYIGLSVRAVRVRLDNERAWEEFREFLDARKEAN